MNTPWGQSNDQKEYAPGIVFYGTPSHGGFHLGRTRQATVKRIFPTFSPYAGGPWYEEDEDWRLVVVVFPEYFPAGEVHQAVEAVRLAVEREPAGQWQQVQAWLENWDSLFSKGAKAIAEAWHNENARNYVRGGMSCGAGIKGWAVNFYRVGDNQATTVLMDEYPKKETYTPEELDAIRDPEQMTA